MAVGNGTLYIKADQCVEVKNRDVTLSDLLEMECADNQVVFKLKTIKVMKMPDQGKHRYVISVLKLIERIHKEYPNLDVQNMGSPDIIVVYEHPKKRNAVWQWCKVILVCLLSFVGAAFAIMTFNNDSGTSQLFIQIYELFTGKPHEGFSVLEAAYSIGLAAGIIVFFNHFGKRKFTVDPSPIEIEMQLYEQDIQTTIIAEHSRKGQEIDVDQSDCDGVYRL